MRVTVRPITVTDVPFIAEAPVATFPPIPPSPPIPPFPAVLEVVDVGVLVEEELLPPAAPTEPSPPRERLWPVVASSVPFVPALETTLLETEIIRSPQTYVLVVCSERSLFVVLFVLLALDV